MWALWPSSLAALLVVSLAAAYALHITIEKPSLRLRERIAP
jgi:peptidoglycan/LPS O-acetylase OafA/YrhL